MYYSYPRIGSVSNNSSLVIVTLVFYTMEFYERCLTCRTVAIANKVLQTKMSSNDPQKDRHKHSHLLFYKSEINKSTDGLYSSPIPVSSRLVSEQETNTCELTQ